MEEATAKLVTVKHLWRSDDRAPWEVPREVCEGRLLSVAGAHAALKALKAQGGKPPMLPRMRNTPEALRPRPPAMPVPRLRHCTEGHGLWGILSDGGFWGGDRRVMLQGAPRVVQLSCWSPHPECLSGAAEPLLQGLKEGLASAGVPAEDIGQLPEDELRAMLTNAPSCSSGSRDGSFQLSLGLWELLDAYGAQFCEGAEPELRVLATDLYKQEIAHCLVVHGPKHAAEFGHLPRVPREGEEGAEAADQTAPASDGGPGTLVGEQAGVEENGTPAEEAAGQESGDCPTAGAAHSEAEGLEVSNADGEASIKQDEGGVSQAGGETPNAQPGEQSPDAQVPGTEGSGEGGSPETADGPKENGGEELAPAAAPLEAGAVVALKPEWGDPLGPVYWSRAGELCWRPESMCDALTWRLSEEKLLQKDTRITPAIWNSLVIAFHMPGRNALLKVDRERLRAVLEACGPLYPYKHRVRSAREAAKEKTPQKRVKKDATPVETPATSVNAKGVEVLEKGITGVVKWFNVHDGYGFIKRKDNNKDVFVHHTAVEKNNPRKAYRSLGTGEEVLFDLVKGKKGSQAAHVTGPGGVAVQGSKYAPDRKRYRYPPNYRTQNYRNTQQNNAPVASYIEYSGNRGTGRPRRPFRQNQYQAYWH
ncbi:uncharacterized protein [Ambystoma mexicanum]|uniref:uncharacterized protein n=1 Tax=Ambystoma mexicanum TaxID=8296 RepID=UPI0037E78BED